MRRGAGSAGSRCASSPTPPSCGGGPRRSESPHRRSSLSIITIANSHIEPLDSILFFTGLGAMVLTLLALAMHLGVGHGGPARVGYTVGAFMALVLVGATISFVFDAAGRRVFSPANIGLHGEWSFFSVALCLLALSVWASRRLGHEAAADA